MLQQAYVDLIVKKFLKNRILEVGAGIGSFTKNYLHLSKDIFLTETDSQNFNILKKKFQNKKIKDLKNQHHFNHPVFRKKMERT